MNNFINNVLLHVESHQSMLFDTSENDFGEFDKFDLNELQQQFLNRGFKLTNYEDATEFEKSEYFMVPHTRSYFLVYKL